ncbi:MAG: MFS transporter [Haloferacaceae archaeon]|nr:MFS transporter [Haloferacaceae archaeon]
MTSRRPPWWPWLGWAALAAGFYLVNIQRLSTAVLSEAFTTAFVLSAAQLGTLHAAFFAVYAVLQLPTGIVVDRYGSRLTASVGMLTVAAGSLVMAAAGGFAVAVLARLLIGAGASVIFIAILRYAASWFPPRRFATVTGMTAGVAGLGAISAATPLAVLVGSVGVTRSFELAAVAAVVVAGAVWVLVRRGAADAAQREVDAAGVRAQLRALMRDPDQWLLSLVFFAGNGTTVTIMGLWGVPYLVAVYGLSVADASVYTLIGSVGILVGGPSLGWLSDRLAMRLRPMIAGLGLTAAALAVIPLVGQPPLWAIAAIYATVGASIGVSLLSMTAIKERYPPSAAGVATAAVNTWGFVGATLLPVAMGIAVDQYRTGAVVGGSVVYTPMGYRIAFAIAAGVVGLAALGAVGVARRA